MNINYIAQPFQSARAHGVNIRTCGSLPRHLFLGICFLMYSDPSGYFKPFAFNLLVFFFCWVGLVWAERCMRISHFTFPVAITDKKINAPRMGSGRNEIDARGLDFPFSGGSRRRNRQSRAGSLVRSVVPVRCRDGWVWSTKSFHFVWTALNY